MYTISMVGLSQTLETIRCTCYLGSNIAVYVGMMIIYAKTLFIIGREFEWVVRLGFDVALDFSVGMCILHEIWGPNDGFAI